MANLKSGKKYKITTECVGPVRPMVMRRTAAFTLVEALLSITVFSLGILIIFPSFFKSMELLAALSGRYPADLLINNALVETEEHLRAFGSLELTAATQTADWNGRSYRYRVDARVQESSARLYETTVRVDWRDIRDHKMSRTSDILR